MSNTKTIFETKRMSLGGPLFGQQTSGNLVRTIYDPTAATTPGVQGTAHDNATGIDATTTTTSADEYRFNNLPARIYTLLLAPGVTTAGGAGMG